MEEKELSNEESLRLINRMIYEAKGYFYESGISILIYGFSVLICSLLSYLRDAHIINFPFNPFYVLIPIFIVQSFVQMREEKKKKAKTFTDEAIDNVWTGFFLAAIAVLSGCFANAGYVMITMILFLLGLASFITGALTKFRYMIIAGVLCLVTGAVSFFIQNEKIYFLLAAAAILVYIIPGLMLRAYFKKQKHY